MIITRTLSIRTQGASDIVDITASVEDAIRDSRLSTGTVTVFVRHTTAGVSVIETEDGLLDDYRAFWERVAPTSIDYGHNRSEGEDNGHAHVRATTLGPSLVIPFVGRHMTLGIWQKVILMDFDTDGRIREVVLQIMGE